jgi:hypothetical protein
MGGERATARGALPPESAGPRGAAAPGGAACAPVEAPHARAPSRGARPSAGAGRELPQRLSPTHPPGRIPQLYRRRVVALDADARTATLASGERLRYGKLLSTCPLDALLGWLGRPEWAAGLRHSSTHVVGVGIRGAWCAVLEGGGAAKGGRGPVGRAASPRAPPHVSPGCRSGAVGP